MPATEATTVQVNVIEPFAVVGPVVDEQVIPDGPEITQSGGDGLVGVAPPLGGPTVAVRV